MLTPEEQERTSRYIARLEQRYRTLRDEVEEDVADYRNMPGSDGPSLSPN